MAGGQRLISWLHPYSTSNVALNTRICAHGPLMGHPNWVGCDSFNVVGGWNLRGDGQGNHVMWDVVHLAIKK
jgi:hypothetical protein